MKVTRHNCWFICFLALLLFEAAAAGENKNGHSSSPLMLRKFQRHHVIKCCGNKKCSGPIRRRTTTTTTEAVTDEEDDKTDSSPMTDPSPSDTTIPQRHVTSVKQGAKKITTKEISKWTSGQYASITSKPTTEELADVSSTAVLQSSKSFQSESSELQTSTHPSITTQTSESVTTTLKTTQTPESVTITLKTTQTLESVTTTLKTTQTPESVTITLKTTQTSESVTTTLETTQTPQSVTTTLKPTQTDTSSVTLNPSTISGVLSTSFATKSVNSTTAIVATTSVPAITTGTKTSQTLTMSSATLISSSSASAGTTVDFTSSVVTTHVSDISVASATTSLSTTTSNLSTFTSTVSTLTSSVSTLSSTASTLTSERTSTTVATTTEQSSTTTAQTTTVQTTTTQPPTTTRKYTISCTCPPNCLCDSSKNDVALDGYMKSSKSNGTFTTICGKVILSNNTNLGNVTLLKNPSMNASELCCVNCLKIFETATNIVYELSSTFDKVKLSDDPVKGSSLQYNIVNKTGNWNIVTSNTYEWGVTSVGPCSPNLQLGSGGPACPVVENLLNCTKSVTSATSNPATDTLCSMGLTLTPTNKPGAICGEQIKEACVPTTCQPKFCLAADCVNSPTLISTSTSLATVCGGTSNSLCMSACGIMSPNYPANYPMFQDCFWSITAPIGQQLVVKFTAFRTEDSYDKLTVYDGDSVVSPLVGTFSGATIPSDIVSTSNKMYIEFHTDASNAFSGFKLSFMNGTC